MSDRLRVVVVDDHPLLRAGVVRTLSREIDIEVVAEGTCAEDAVRLSREWQPDIILLDVSMNGGGIAAAEEISKSCPQVKIVMLTVCEDEANISAAFAAGASGYILKGVGSADLLQSLQTIRSGALRVSPLAPARQLAEGRVAQRHASEIDVVFSGLSPRERQFMEYLAAGQSNREIAEKMDLAEKTVRREMAGLIEKMKVSGRVKAALLAQHLIGGSR